MPAAEVVEEDFEVVEDEPMARPKPAAKKPVKAAVDEDEDDVPRSKKKKGKKNRRKSDEDDEDSADRKTPQGMILNGLGLVGLGIGGIIFYFVDEPRQIGLLIAGILCIGSIITGVTKKGGGKDDDDE